VIDRVHRVHHRLWTKVQLVFCCSVFYRDAGGRECHPCRGCFSFSKNKKRCIIIEIIDLNCMSCENVKQLRIKSSMLRRLRKEYDSYQKEVKGIENKIGQMQSDLLMLQNDEEL
jgi:hypothetical protein